MSLIPCHHFSAQHVLSIDDEPLVVSGASTDLFVATANCAISHYVITKNASEECNFVGSFPSVAAVSQMAYSKKGNFLVTIERLSTHHHTLKSEDILSVRVYTNLHHDTAHHAVSASVAGQLRSMRLDGSTVDNDSCDRLNAIEIPLKASPKSVAVNSSMCQFAVSLQTRVLIYGLNSGNRTAGCFSDVKFILELDFAFKIHTLSLCEEFLVCASSMECQAIQLNFSPNKNSHVVEEFSGISRFLESSAGNDSQNTGVHNDTDSSGKINDSAADGAMDSTANDVSLAVSDSSDVCSRSSPFSHQMNLRQEFVHSDLGMTQMAHECDELFVGPVKGSQAPCPVSVEFEDTDAHDCGSSNVLSSGVTTWMYAKLYSGQRIVSIQLLPVYKPRGSETVSKKQASKFVSAERRQLSEMLCFISTPSVGYLYSIGTSFHLLANYQYATIATQVAVTENWLYAISPGNLEVYKSQRQQQSVPGDIFSPLFVGRYHFVNLHAICCLNSHVAVLSKTSALTGYDSSWNVCVLTCPTTEQFRSDVLELMQSCQETAKYKRLAILAAAVSSSAQATDDTCDTNQTKLCGQSSEEQKEDKMLSIPNSEDALQRDVVVVDVYNNGGTVDDFGAGANGLCATELSDSAYKVHTTKGDAFTGFGGEVIPYVDDDDNVSYIASRCGVHTGKIDSSSQVVHCTAHCGKNADSFVSDMSDINFHQANHGADHGSETLYSFDQIDNIPYSVGQKQCQVDELANKNDEKPCPVEHTDHLSDNGSDNGGQTPSYV